VTIYIVCDDCEEGASPSEAAARCARCDKEWTDSAAQADEALEAVWKVRSQMLVSDETHAALELVRSALQKTETK
jgi:hypothetical protein